MRYIKNISLALAYKPRANDLSTTLILKNKNESETFSIAKAKQVAKKLLGITDAEISISRIKISNQNFREYRYRNLLLVREKTYIRKNKQFEEREVYPYLCEKKVDLV
jgi:hypothetical protein